MSKTAIITGATSGIGKCLALNLALRGIEVVGQGRNLEKLKELSHLSSNIHPIQIDFLSEIYLEKLLEQLSGYSKFTYFIHCAGITIPSYLRTLSPQVLRDHIRVNLEPALTITQCLLPMMTGGRALFISSGLANRAGKAQAAYSISKAALKMLYRGFNNELQEEVSVGYVELPAVSTNMHNGILNANILSKDDNEYYTKLRSRMISPEQATAFLADILLSSTNQEFRDIEWRYPSVNG